MAIIGPRAALDLVFPANGLDVAHILNFQNRSGATAQEIITRAATVIGTVNERLAAKYAGLTYRTRLAYGRYGQGEGSNIATPVSSEFKLPDPVHAGQGGGHMYPIRDYKDTNAWTPEYLRDVPDEQIDRDINLIGIRWENRIDKDILTRALTNTENPVGNAGTGWDVGWAIGSGTNVNYTPNDFGGYTFDNTHTHYYAAAGPVSAATVTAALESLNNNLRHHGHGGRLIAWVSDADLDAYDGIAANKMVRIVPGGVTILPSAGGTTPMYVQPGEIPGVPGETFGYFVGKRGMIELRTQAKIPSGYGFVFKSYGSDSPQNPLVIREHPTQGFGMIPDPQVSKSINPYLEYILYKAVHGVSANDRTAAAAFYIGGATWVNPTIAG